MPVTITLKNIPDALYQSLKLSAERNRRSLNMEAITVLEQSLASRQTITVEERIARVRRLTEDLPASRHDHEDPADIIRRDRDERNARDMAFVDEMIAHRHKRAPSRRTGGKS